MTTTGCLISRVSLTLVAALLVSALAATPPLFADEAYDLVILNGRVMDPETSFDNVRNVGIKDGKIVTITE
ncbi:MAG: hydrolase, partial [Thermoanaerobaculia bacterium]